MVSFEISLPTFCDTIGSFRAISMPLYKSVTLYSDLHVLQMVIIASSLLETAKLAENRHADVGDSQCFTNFETHLRCTLVRVPQ